MFLARRNWRIGIGLSLIMLLAVACAPTADPTATTAAKAEPALTGMGRTWAESDGVVAVVTPANPDAQFGGTIIRYRTTYPSDFSIWEAASGSIITPQKPAFDTLLENNAWEPGKDGELIPNIAYDYWTDSTGLQWTMKLREGIKFSDGVDLTCADAEFMIETVRDGHDSTGSELRQSPRGAALSRVSDVTCTDDYTLVITTDGPMPSIIAFLGGTGTLAIKPKHYFEGQLERMVDDLGPGSGPFLLDEILPGEQWVWKRNPNYWDTPYPYIDRIEHPFGLSSTAREAATRVGRLDVGFLSDPTLIVEMETGELGLDIQALGSHGFGGPQANWTREPWSDPRFSLALRCAIDTEEIIEVVLEGIAFTGGIFPYWSPWGLTEEEVLAIHPCQGPSDKAAPMAERMEIARQAIADMGHGPDNPLHPYWMMWCSSGSANCTRLDRFALYNERLKSIGIESEWEAFETARSYDKAYAGEFDVIPWGFLTPMFDPDTWLYEHYYSTSDRNYGKYTNPEVDALIDLQSVTLDSEKRAEIIKEISTILLRDNAKIPYYFSSTESIVQPWVKDWYWTNISNMSTTDKMTRVWIDQDMKDELGP